MDNENNQGNRGNMSNIGNMCKEVIWVTKVTSVTEITEITIVLPLSVFLIMSCLFLAKLLSATLSSDVKLSLGCL